MKKLAARALASGGGFCSESMRVRAGILRFQVATSTVGGIILSIVIQKYL
jgi:hypothetical protein